MAKKMDFKEHARAIQDRWRNAASDWKPDPGVYLCRVVGLATGMSEDRKTKAPYGWVQPTFKILEGELEGRQFRGDRYSDRTQGALEMMKGFFERVLIEVTGDLVADSEAIQALIQSGLFCHVEVTISPSDDGERSFTNARVVEVVEAEVEEGPEVQAAQAPPAPPAAQPAPVNVFTPPAQSAQVAAAPPPPRGRRAPSQGG